MIKLIEIELFSFCNRACNWCGNSIIDRISNIQYLNDNHLNSIIDYLEEIDYSQYITFSRYNEPLYDVDYLCNAISKIKSRVKKCKFVTNTNGDYVTKEKINKLSEYIDEITIMDYDHNRINFYINELELKNIEYTEYGIYGEYNDLKICLHNFWNVNNANNRGGILSLNNNIRNTNSCIHPLGFVGIDYNGNIVPCCNIRSDFDKHFEYICGSLNKDSFKNIINSDKRMQLINNMSCLNNDICKKCTAHIGRYLENNPSIYYVKR